MPITLADVPGGRKPDAVGATRIPCLVQESLGFVRIVLILPLDLVGPFSIRSEHAFRKRRNIAPWRFIGVAAVVNEVQL